MIVRQNAVNCTIIGQTQGEIIHFHLSATLKHKEMPPEASSLIQPLIGLGRGWGEWGGGGWD